MDGAHQDIVPSSRDIRELRSRAGLGDEVTVRGSAAVLAQNMQITGGSFTSAGRDVHNHIHIHEAAKVDLKSVLESIDNCRQIQQDILSKAAPRTGEWVFDIDQFPVWRQPGSEVKVIWGIGIPGAGKTVLTSIVVDTIARWAEGYGPSICVAFFYIRYSDNEGLTARDVLEVFVKQIIEKNPNCYQLAEQAYAEHIRLKTRPTELELLNLLQRFANMEKATFYFLDALDETSLQTQSDLIKKLSALDKVKVFVTSRPLKFLEAQFPEAHRFTITAHDDDLALYINQVIADGPVLSRILQNEAPALRSEIISSVKRKCDGMFLHASLQLDALKECTSIHDIQETLVSFPVKIENAYILTWERIMNQKANRSLMAQICLLWVLNAAKSMTVEELQHAHATSLETHKFDQKRVVDEGTLIAVCCGLLVMDEKTKRVRLVHLTARTIMERLILETSPHLHSQLASLCMARLRDHSFQRWEDPFRRLLSKELQADPLLPNAYFAWPNYARNSLNDPTSVTRIRDFIKGCHAFPIPNGDWIVTLLNPLHVVAFFNLPVELAGLTALEALGPNTRTADGETALHLACRRASHLAIKGLLALRLTDVNAPDRFGRTPLILAARAGDEGTVKLLVAHPGVKINLEDPEGLTAMIWAAREGHEGVVKLLIVASQPQIHGAVNDGKTSLIWAASTGNTPIVRLLLSTSVEEVHTTDNEGRTPLIWASKEGYEETVKLLLSASELEVGVPDHVGRTPLIWAASEGHQAIVQLLLAVSQAQVHVADLKGRTPLAWAASHGDAGVIRLLLETSRDEVHAGDRDAWTPLMWAASAGKTAAVELLIAASEAEVHSIDRWGRTPLVWAVKGGHEDTVRALVTTSQVELMLADGDGRIPLMWAAAEGHKPVVEALIGAAPEGVHAKDNEGRTALSWAASRNRQDTVKLLLDTSQNEVHLADKNGLIPLSHAARAPGSIEIVKLLIATSDGGAINSQDQSGHTPLILAAMQSRMYGDMGQFPNDPAPTISSLLEVPQVDVNLADNEGMTPLIWASKQGHWGAVKALLDHEASNVNAQDNSGRTALGWAIKRGHEDVAELIRVHPRLKPGFGKRLGKRLDSAVGSVSGFWKRK